MWQVLLIGGASAAGKSTLAKQIAFAEGATVRSLDEMLHQEDERLLLSHPEVWDTPADVLRLLRRASQEFAPAIDASAYEALNEGRRIIIEGERLRPDTTAQLLAHVGPLLGVLFLVEDEPESIRQNLLAKSRGFRLLDERRQANVVRVDFEYGQWLEREAKAVGLPVLRPQPWATLWARAQLELSRMALSGVVLEGST